MLQKSLESLGEGDWEILAWVDDDDFQIQQYAKLPMSLFIRPRVGYENFNLMVNYLAKQSSGEWLLLWNDDMRLDNDGLYEKINKFDFNKPVVLNFWDPANPRNNLAPVISRKMFDIMGHFSLSTHCDSWVQDIANELDIHKPIVGVETVHLREILSDDTKLHTQSVYATSSPLYDSEEMLKLRRKDTVKIQAEL